MIKPTKRILILSLAQADKDLKALRNSIAHARSVCPQNSEAGKRLAKIHKSLPTDDLLDIGIEAIETGVAPNRQKTPKASKPEPVGKPLPKESNKVLELLKGYAPNYIQKQRVAEECELTMDQLDKALEPLYKRNFIDGEREIRYIGA